MMDSNYVPGLASVIIPTYNRAHLIGNALESVQRQTYRPIEVIVVDDGSNDDTASVVSQWASAVEDPNLAVACVQKRNAGAPSARNDGLRRARGEFIQFLDSDDLLLPRKLERQVAGLRTNPNVGCAWSDMAVATPRDAMSYVRGDSVATAARRLNDGIAMVGVPVKISLGVLRRSACVAAGNWNEALVRHQDWLYSLQLMAAGCTTLHIPGPEYVEVLHSGERISSVERDPERALEADRRALEAAEELGLGRGTVPSMRLAYRYWGMVRRAAEHGSVSHQLYAANGLKTLLPRLPRFGGYRLRYYFYRMLGDRMFRGYVAGQRRLRI